MKGMKAGLYYLLLNNKLKALLEENGVGSLAELSKCGTTDVARLVSRELAEEVRKFVEDEFSNCGNDIEKSRKIVEDYFSSEDFKKVLYSIVPDQDPKILSEIKQFKEQKTTIKNGEFFVGHSSLIVPTLPGGPKLVECLRKELQSCDKLQMLVSFLKLSGVDNIYNELHHFCKIPRSDNKPRLEIATTTYIGASDLKAIEKLMKLPNTEIRMSYDGKTQRLHAKAYLFHRDNGFSTAYIGSANLSGVAISTGLEWTAKIAECEMPSLWLSAKSAFIKSWEDDKEFVRKTLKDLDEIKKALDEARGSGSKSSEGKTVLSTFIPQPHPYQVSVLEDIAKERAAGRHRHLVVAATGTGKTMMAAFDYVRQKIVHGGNLPKLLYIVHRQDILRQVRDKYRAVLRDEDFGVILPSETIDKVNAQYVFCTPASWKSRIKGEGKWPNGFDCIVIDECHHAAADSYEEIVNYYAADIDAGNTDLLGLTATPDREDGKDIRLLFGGSFTHELSLAYAIAHQHLVPYRYMIAKDVGVDYTGVHWHNKATVESEIAKLLEANSTRAKNVIAQVHEHVPDEHAMRAIGFCAGVNHAKFMSEQFNTAGISATYLEGKSSDATRKKAFARLNSDGEDRINIIFAADLLNEGVDFPNVDTILMLRPTSSVTIYTQQLGRGLRKPDFGVLKSSLLVLDFVSDQNEMFDEEMRFKVLSGKPNGSTKKALTTGVFELPPGCDIVMSEVAKKTILDNIERRQKTLRGQNLVNEILKWIRDHKGAMHLLDILEVMGVDKNDVKVDDAIRLYAQTKCTPSLLSMLALDPSKARTSKERERLAKLILRLNQTEDYDLVEKWRKGLMGVGGISNSEKFEFATCWDLQKVKKENYEQVWDQIKSDDIARYDVLEFLDLKLSQSLPLAEKVKFPQSGNLVLHGRYHRTQITHELCNAYGYLPQSGVVPIKSTKSVAFFVTRIKDESQFTPETMYKDFAITQDKVKWDSQNKTKADSSEAKSYIDGSVTPLLFIQKSKQAEGDVPESFVYLGPMEYISHEGECPISFEWRLKYPMPASVYEWAKI